MKLHKLSSFAALSFCLAVCATVLRRDLSAQSTPTVRVQGDDIGGVVTGPKGPEAGVWVIAETGDLPTKFAKIVVTDDRGRFLLPGLPKASYKVWARGYGLLDSQPVQSATGKIIDLKTS